MAEEAGDQENNKPSGDVERFHREVKEARELLEFAIAEGRAVPDRLIAAIKKAEEFLRSRALPTPDERTTFEQAYRDLVQFLAPVTVHTLRATSDAHGRKVFPIAWRQQLSEGKIWSRKLWLLTTLFVLLALFGDNLKRVLDQFFPAYESTEESVLRWQVVSFIFQSLVPFTYGAIGSLAYLLRSCHEYIYKREFDPHRIPEYYNRLLLGIVSGGAILLFIDQITTDQGTIKLSEAALAFLTGYNTDFLFTAIERVSQAILPKVGLDTVQRGQAGGPAFSASLEHLLDRRDKAATPQEKQFLEDLLNKLVERR